MHSMAREELDHLIAMAEGLRDGRIVPTSREEIETWTAICRGSVDLIADLCDESLAVGR